MIDINLLKKSGFFKTKVLKKGETLFDEGDFDDNLYIIVSGILKIEKYTSLKRNETKTLATIEKNEIFGEASLNSDKEKEVKIVSLQETELVYINAKKGLNSFSKKYPEEGLNILKYIIFLSNKRLLESNYLITANYKISKEINNLKEINNKNIFKLIQKLKDIVKVDYIIYLEENTVMKEYISIKYDSRFEGKMQDKILEKKENNLFLLELKTKGYNNYEQKLSIGKQDLGYLIFFKKGTNFKENDKKVFLSVSTLIAGLIKQKQYFEEESNKEYMKY